MQPMAKRTRTRLRALSNEIPNRVVAHGSTKELAKSLVNLPAGCCALCYRCCCCCCCCFCGRRFKTAYKLSKQTANQPQQQQQQAKQQKRKAIVCNGAKGRKWGGGGKTAKCQVNDHDNGKANGYANGWMALCVSRLPSPTPTWSWTSECEPVATDLRLVNHWITKLGGQVAKWVTGQVTFGQSPV